jgi:hypothetical protein
MVYGMRHPEILIAMQRLGLLGLSYRTADQDAIGDDARRAGIGEFRRVESMSLDPRFLDALADVVASPL